MTRINRERSRALAERLAALVPGGAHTYAKGPDQYPDGRAPIIARGRGALVWDVDGNEYVEYGSGLRAVALGHAEPRVLAAVRAALDDGSNFARPSALEVEAAECLAAQVPSAAMVKFAKNGSDVTTAAVKLARAFTGRDLVAICEQPFFSIDDWFIGRTAMPAGIPDAVRALTVTFRHNDLESLRALLAAHPGRIACVVMEAEAGVEPEPGFLEGVRSLCTRDGALLVFDEMIAGYRLAIAGGQELFGIVPDLATFGKAMANGFALSALTGRRDVMELGGFPTERDRVFLLSTTHGAETHALAAFLAVSRIYAEDGIIERLAERGARLASGVRAAAIEAGVGEQFTLHGHAANLVYATRDAAGLRSQPFRTLFLQELLERGVLAPSFVVSAALTDAEIDRTVDAVRGALGVYRRALEEGVDRYLEGRPVQPVFRPRG